MIYPFRKQYNMADSPERKHENDDRHLEQVETQYDIDPIIDKRVTRKFDVHIIPWLFGIW
jgi:hypothetical protein